MPQPEQHQPNHEDIVNAARLWLGTRWHHQGRSAAGVDCIGLVIKVGEAFGFQHEDQIGYRRNPDGVHFLNLVREQTIREVTPRPGTIGVFREQHYPCHTGIFALRDGKLSLIHAYAVAGKVVEEYFTDTWLAKLIEVRGYTGVVDAQPEIPNG